MFSPGGDTIKGLLLPSFDRDKNNFKGWWMRFKAFPTIKHFVLPLRELQKEKDLPQDEATDVSTDKQKQLARDRNLMAIACMTSAFKMKDC
jgi:hypothetical protein